MLVIFPFEEAFYKKHNINTTYVGHPFLDTWKPENKNELKQWFGFNKNKKLIGVFPGSRSEEIKRHLPIYIKSINKLKENYLDYEFALGLAPSFDKETIEKNYTLNNIKIITEKPIKLLECCDVAIVTSGTISLQASLVGTPCVVNYKLSFISWMLSKLLIKVKYMSMTNIIAKKMVLPELMQYKVKPKNINKEVNKILNDSVYANKLNVELAAVKNIFLDRHNSINNAAKIIAEICHEKN